MLYFAYGADLSSHAILDFCHQHGRPVPRRLEVRPAILANHRIQFSNYDSFWRGGVADVIAETGKSVSGALMDVSSLGLETLRIMSGSRNKISANVKLFSGGSPIEAVMFCEGRPNQSHVPPTAAYLDRMINAAVQLGLSTMWIMQLQTFGTIAAGDDRSPLRGELNDGARPAFSRRRPVVQTVRPSIKLDDLPELLAC